MTNKFRMFHCSEIRVLGKAGQLGSSGARGDWPEALIEANDFGVRAVQVTTYATHIKVSLNGTRDNAYILNDA